MAVEFMASTSSFLGGAPGTAKKMQGRRANEGDGEKERERRKSPNMLRQ